jgi:hypothetical protein
VAVLLLSNLSSLATSVNHSLAAWQCLINVCCSVLLCSVAFTCRRAVDAGSSRINFVPTHHWLPDETSPNGISSFCYMDTVAPSSEDTLGKDQYECFPWSQSIIQEYTQAMQVCFAEALRQGLTIYVRWVVARRPLVVPMWQQ